MQRGTASAGAGGVEAPSGAGATGYYTTWLGDPVSVPISVFSGQVAIIFAPGDIAISGPAYTHYTDHLGSNLPGFLIGSGTYYITPAGGAYGNGVPVIAAIVCDLAAMGSF